MLEKFRPGALHERLWPPLTVISAIGVLGLMMLLAVS